jgi:SAM-dependent methyltransferase
MHVADDSRIAQNIEAICGKPLQITHPVYQKLTDALRPLLPRVNQRLADGKGPCPPIASLAKSPEQRDFIRAAAHYFPRETFELANLVTVRPPDNIHRMQRSDPYWVGDFFSANMIVHALGKSGQLRASQSVLDIGCSSGSLVRVLAAYDRSWILHGRDPIVSAANWASAHVTTGSFKPMDIKPPLDFDANSLDGVTAISVWSHHRADAAQVWIDEIARILRPGGWFAVTFSTLHHIYWMANKQKADPGLIDEMLIEMARTGNHFVPVKYMGEDAETDIDWGQSCYSREYFFEMFRKSFNVAGYFPGLNQGNQDVAVFTKI